MLWRMAHSWRPHLWLVATVLVTVPVPAVLALTHLASRNLDTHRYEVEHALRGQYRKSLELLDRSVAARLDVMEADILAAVRKGPAKSAALRAVNYWRDRGGTAHVDLLDPRGEPPPLADPLSVPKPERCQVGEHWFDMAGAAELAFVHGRNEEAAGFFKALAEGKSAEGNCPQSRCPSGKCPAFVHLLGLCGQVRSAIAGGDTATALAKLEHLVDHHLADEPPDCTEPLPPAAQWYLRTRRPADRADLAGRIRTALSFRRTGGPAARTALAELADHLGWRAMIEQSRACGLWHQSALNLVRNGSAASAVGPKRFVRLAHPDLTLLAVAREAEGGFVTYRVDPKRWRVEIDALLADIPDDTVAELSDAAGVRLAGEAIPDGPQDLVQTRALEAVPGWHLRLGPRDPGRLAVAAERLAWTTFALVGLVAASVSAGLALLLVNYLRQARLARMQAEFVSGVSHELKTPLALLRLSAETLYMGRYRTEADGRELLRRIVGDVERLSRLVGRILDFSKLSRHRDELRFAPVDLVEVVTDLLAQYRPQFEELSAVVEVRPLLDDSDPGALPPVRADESAVRQVLVNLLDNALRYTEGPPRITLSAAVAGKTGAGGTGSGMTGAGGTVRLTIADCGIGMGPATQKRIFEQFYRGDEPAVQRHRGTGLGLAIVRNILAAHGGEIVVESVPGAGSAFTIVLPVWTGG
jgi:signal transduction histidine kinase